MAEHQPTVVEQMAEAHQNSKAKNMGALEWWQLHTPDREGFTDAMLAALRVLHLAFRDAGNEAAENSIFNVMAQHERLRGG